MCVCVCVCVWVCVWYDGRGLSKAPRERGFLLSALFFFVSFLLDEGSNSEIRAAPTGQVCYACGENACVLLAHTRREAAHMRRREKVTTKNVKPSERAEKIPCLVYRNGREGTDEWEGREFIFRKEWKQNLWRMSRKQDRVWERRILQPQNQSTIPLSGRWNAEVLCTVSPGCEVNLYLRLSPVSFCIEGKESFDEGWFAVWAVNTAIN